MRKGNLIGWKGIAVNKGKFVPADEGVEYVFEQVGIMAFNHDAPDATIFLDELVEWYFSGNWIEVYAEDEDGK